LFAGAKFAVYCPTSPFLPCQYPAERALLALAMFVVVDECLYSERVKSEFMLVKYLFAEPNAAVR
jgi:hypothetical protein